MCINYHYDKNYMYKLLWVKLCMEFMCIYSENEKLWT
jgi:hypothetical protein